MDDQDAGEIRARIHIATESQTQKRSLPVNYSKRVYKVLELPVTSGQVKDLYCHENGRPGIDPEVAIRLLLAGYFQGIVHDRKLMK